MHTHNQNPHFFLAAASPQGFASRFSEFIDIDNDWHTYIIKGGPGSGKSTFIHRVIAALEKYDSHIEQIHCSSDPESLDGAIFHTLKVSIVDGTSPHAMEPKYLGAYESLVPLSECLNDDLLYENRHEIRELADENKFHLERSSRFLSAAASLLNDTYRLAFDATDISKIARFTTRLVHREMKPLKKDREAKEYARFLSAITPEGILLYTETAAQYCERIYIINDDYGAASRLVLGALRTNALQAGYDVISCYCPISPFDKIDHLFIPEAGIGFMTSNRWHRLDDYDAYRTIHCRRFTDMDKVRTKKQRISFNRRAIKELLGESAELKAEAKEVHDRLEAYYIQAMDFDLWEDFLAKTILQIMERIL